MMNDPHLGTRLPQNDLQSFTPRKVHIKSQKAAEAAENVVELETENEALHRQLRELKALLEVAEQKNGSLQSELLALRDERDYYQKRCIEITTKLQMVGQVVLDVMREGPVQEYKRQDISEQSKLALDQALASGEEKPDEAPPHS